MNHYNIFIPENFTINFNIINFIFFKYLIHLLEGSIIFPSNKYFSFFFNVIKTIYFSIKLISNNSDINFIYLLLYLLSASSKFFIYSFNNYSVINVISGIFV